MRSVDTSSQRLGQGFDGEHEIASFRKAQTPKHANTAMGNRGTHSSHPNYSSHQYPNQGPPNTNYSYDMNGGSQSYNQGNSYYGHSQSSGANNNYNNRGDYTSQPNSSYNGNRMNGTSHPSNPWDNRRNPSYNNNGGNMNIHSNYNPHYNGNSQSPNNMQGYYNGYGNSRPMDHPRNGQSYNGNQGYNIGSPSHYNDMNSSYNNHNSQPTSYQQPFTKDNNQDGLTRAVSTSFGDADKSSTKSKNNHYLDSLSTPDFDFGKMKDVTDESSITSKADSEFSWKQLHQVASIDEDRYRSKSMSKNRKSSKSEHKYLSSSKLDPFASLPSVSSFPDPLQPSNSHDDDDDFKIDFPGAPLLQTNSSDSLLFPGENITKRAREEREDTETRNRESEEVKRDEASSPPNVAGLSMKDKSPRPNKKRRPSQGSTDFYERPPANYSFDIESVPSFTKDDKNSVFPSLERVDSGISWKQGDEGNKDGLRVTMSSWDLGGQDSFGGVLTIDSRESADEDDNLLSTSFSFTNDNDIFPLKKEPKQSTQNSQEKKIDSQQNQNNPAPVSNNHSYGSQGMPHQDNMYRRNDSYQAPHPNTPYPPHAPSWGSNGSMHSHHGFPGNRESDGGPRSPHPNHLSHNGYHRSGSFGGGPPQSQGMYPRHLNSSHDEMMRNYSQDSGGSVSGSHYHSHYPAYGSPAPPSHHPSDHNLPHAFRPPVPEYPRHQMVRRPPPAVFMPSPPGQRHGIHGRGISDLSQGGSKSGPGGVFSWSKDDDVRLTEIMKRYKNPKDRDWDSVAKEFGRGKSSKECHERWIRYLKPGVRKGQWQDHEDAIVVEAVTTSTEQPFTRWSDLATRLPGRVGKQIRDRWVNHLNPNINHMPFSREDDLRLWEGHKKLGKRWVEISTKYFNSSRSENHIKNRWYSASFKKFISNEFGPDAYIGGNKGKDKDQNDDDDDDDDDRNDMDASDESSPQGHVKVPETVSL